MWHRPAFWLILGFWAVMNVLLWRLEYHGAGRFGSEAPPELVWEKILTAPDSSTLEIMHEGRKLGYVRWIPNVGSPDALTEEGLEAQIAKPSEYTIDVEGNILRPGPGEGRLRFDIHAVFSDLQTWREFRARLTSRPQVWQISGNAADERLTFGVKGTDGDWERSLTFDELRNPSRLMQSLGLPVPGMLAGSLLPMAEGSSFSLGLVWEARHDWLLFGESRLRVYRLRTRFLEEYEINIILSRVGEILRMELPNEVVLQNDAFIRL